MHWIIEYIHDDNGDRELAAALLNRPLSEQKASAEETLRLRRLLEEYLRSHTEILLE